MPDYFDFEESLQALDEDIAALSARDAQWLSREERSLLQEYLDTRERRAREIYSNLTSWQTIQIARHANRPHTVDYIRHLCSDFFELHGDRAFGDDCAIISGPALLCDRSVMLIGHQKGRNIEEKKFHNFGMPHPEGYRKASRSIQQADKLGLPVICLIDTPGAFPGLEDEQRGQAAAIASNLYLMATTGVPIIAVVIGEGGSGGALAISIADRIIMLEHSIYTVATPEAAASILWRDKRFAPEAANAMRMSARELFSLRLIDDIIPEPHGGAHRDHQLAAHNLQVALLKHLDDLACLPICILLEQRYQKFRDIGVFSCES